MKVEFGAHLSLAGGKSLWWKQCQKHTYTLTSLLLPEASFTKQIEFMQCVNNDYV